MDVQDSWPANTGYLVQQAAIRFPGVPRESEPLEELLGLLVLETFRWRCACFKGHVETILAAMQKTIRQARSAGLGRPNDAGQNDEH